MPTFGSLFAGIGGIDLGLERAGWTPRWQVEWDVYCQRVLAKHWPDVPRFGDIHDVHGPLAHASGGEDRGLLVAGMAPDVGASGQGWCSNCLPPVDLLAGGFPCQPFSVAGKQRRLDDDRWLWPEFARTIRELRPRYVLVENVSGILVGGGMDAVLGDLAELGYDAEWESIPAAAVGAPHLRYRVWIVAYRAELGRPLADAYDGRSLHAVPAGRDAAGHGCADGLADTIGQRGRGWDRQRGWWTTEPDVGRVAHGVPARVDRLRSLGNAVVPQVVEWIGRRILEAEAVT